MKFRLLSWALSSALVASLGLAQAQTGASTGAGDTLNPGTGSNGAGMGSDASGNGAAGASGNGATGASGNGAAGTSTGTNGPGVSTTTTDTSTQSSPMVARTRAPRADRN
jgi:hypothetical protein